MLFLVPLALAGAPFGAANHKPLPPLTDNFDFVAFGDNRPVGAGMPPTPIFRSILKDVANLGPAFVLSSGDIVFGKNEPLATFESECDSIQTLINALPCPLFNAPGNHEISDRKDLYDEYTKRFGATYGSFKFGKWKFIEISTEEVGFSPAISPMELGWLNNELSSPEPKIVFHHHPLFVREGNTEVGAGIANHDMVDMMYKSGNVKYAFQGHDHVFNHQTHDGIEFYITGGAGAPLDAPPADGGYFHFLVVHVRGTKVEVDPIPAGAIQITPTANGIIVGNYSDFPLHFHHLTVRCSTKPGSVEAHSVKKKSTPVAVRVVSVEPASGGYAAVLDLTAPPHLPTYIDLSP
ncbi:MAG: metallophosphoesterase family protein [Fimbriimonadaceae bacterium]